MKNFFQKNSKKLSLRMPNTFQISHHSSKSVQSFLRSIRGRTDARTEARRSAKCTNQPTTNSLASGARSLRSLRQLHFARFASNKKQCTFPFLCFFSRPRCMVEQIRRWLFLRKCLFFFVKTLTKKRQSPPVPPRHARLNGSYRYVQ